MPAEIFGGNHATDHKGSLFLPAAGYRSGLSRAVGVTASLLSLRAGTADLAAKQEAAKQEAVVWPLSEQERLVIEHLR